MARERWGIFFPTRRIYAGLHDRIGTMARIKGEFDKRNVKVLAISVDPIESHKGWIRTSMRPKTTRSATPLIADPDRKVAMFYDMIHPNAMDNMTVGRCS